MHAAVVYGRAQGPRSKINPRALDSSELVGLPSPPRDDLDPLPPRDVTGFPGERSLNNDTSGSENAEKLYGRPFRVWTLTVPQQPLKLTSSLGRGQKLRRLKGGKARGEGRGGLEHPPLNTLGMGGGGLKPPVLLSILYDRIA